MARCNEEVVRYGRPTSANRARDFLVMLAFSLAALGAAFGFVHLKFAGGTAEGTSRTSVEARTSVAPPEGESVREPVHGLTESALASAMKGEAQARSELRIDLERVRGELAATIARMTELEQAVRELQAAPTRDPQPAPEARPISEAKPSASSDAAPAAQPTRADGNSASKDDAARVQAEDVAPNPGETMRYVVRSGDTAAKIAQRHCLSLADLLRLNPDVRNPDALGIRQVLAVEDRCVLPPKERAAAD